MKSWWPPRAAVAGLLAMATALVVLALGGQPLQAANGQAIENPHGSFRGECALCHSSSDWRTLRLSKRFDHARYGFALESAHASAACTSCHQSLDFSRAQTACASCHADPHRGEMGTECARCHGARSFTDRAPMVRAHELTRFPLNGAHATAACEECHRPAAQGQLQFVGTAAECRACHEADYRATRNPDHAAQGFPLDCRGCHTAQTWTSASFDHARTRFPLTGAHVAQACATCHGNGGDFAAADPACASCHQAQYDTATPGHAAAGFPASQCASCHNTTSFSGATFDHGATRFALSGAHASAACLSCHADGVYHDKPRECVSCHEAQYGSALPNHTAAGFAASACASCHGTNTWTGGRFDHAATAFALTGAHQAVSCNSCHSDGVYDGKPTTCISCHASDYSGATPDHAASGFAANLCVTCHNTTTFAGAVFNHDTQTSFTLTGAHRAVSCQSCHSDGVYDGKPTACFACHSSDYSSATVNHTAAGFASGACATCHNTTRWTGTTYNHNATSFPLTGAHTTTTCNSCHGDGVFNNHPTDCASCHQADYDHATPDHRAAGFSTNCVRCHGTTTFAGAVFDHNLNTSFPLTGAHVAQPCAMCHSDGVYAGRSTACASCHMSDYSAATPDHAVAGFAASACASCHNTTTFAGATFNHDTQTSFTLTGAHRTVTCQSCHGDGVYDGKPTACMACHTSDYSGASLNHTAAGFAASACATCHNTTAWTGATYNHNATSFPLTGAHTTTTCNSCHGDGVFNNHAMDCASCHMADYNAAQPPHASSGFAASACATCHTTTTFAGAVFNHSTTAFPLTGAHLAVSCNSCHSDGVYDGKPTACYSCHASDYSAAVPTHTNTTFPTNACATCHTTTAWAGATFNHSLTSFPLTGAHVTTTCQSCHADGVYDSRRPASRATSRTGTRRCSATSRPVPERAVRDLPHDHPPGRRVGWRRTTPCDSRSTRGVIRRAGGRVGIVHARTRTSSAR
ncbi:MAG: hypothetical protein U0704_05935 [Candidatus Eisenbacteria bacterium]